MTKEERKELEELDTKTLKEQAQYYERKAKEIRKKENAFWSEVRERKDEVTVFLGGNTNDRFAKIGKAIEEAAGTEITNIDALSNYIRQYSYKIKETQSKDERGAGVE